MRRPLDREMLRLWAQIALASLLLMATVGAGDNAARFNDLGHRLMCTCGCNQVLLECNHVGCTVSTQMRNELQAALDRGGNDDLILQGFVQKYGPTVLAAPQRSGFGVVAWVTPGAIFVLATLATALLVRHWKQRAVTPLAKVTGPRMEAMRERIRKETEL
ncbi:MAG: cytochrome c-type biogenesis protein [Acidobacteriaceae bacterium]